MSGRITARGLIINEKNKQPSSILAKPSQPPCKNMLNKFGLKGISNKKTIEKPIKKIKQL
jgi:hypothetical protein